MANKIIEIIELYFYELILKQRLLIIKRSEKKIMKLESKLNFKYYYLQKIKEVTKELFKGDELYE